MVAFPKKQADEGASLPKDLDPEQYEIDPDDGLPLAMSWSFPACATPIAAAVETPGTVVFDCDPGAYTAVFEVCDAAAICSVAEMQAPFPALLKIQIILHVMAPRGCRSGGRGAAMRGSAGGRFRAVAGRDAVALPGLSAGPRRLRADH